MGKYDDANNLGFAVFTNDSKQEGDKRPNYTGKIEFTREFLQTLVQQARTGAMPTVSVAFWEKTSQRGQQFLSGKLQYDPRYQQAPDGGQPPGAVTFPAPEPEPDPWA